jgi:hypothetical protein
VVSGFQEAEYYLAMISGGRNSPELEKYLLKNILRCPWIAQDLVSDTID